VNNDIYVSINENAIVVPELLKLSGPYLVVGPYICSPKSEPYLWPQSEVVIKLDMHACLLLPYHIALTPHPGRYMHRPLLHDLALWKSHHRNTIWFACWVETSIGTADMVYVAPLNCSIAHCIPVVTPP
jgi:hypothetical protein